MTLLTTASRYVFHGDSSTAVEYVYVRDLSDLESVGRRWEDAMKFVEIEAARALEYFSGTTSWPKSNSVSCAVGVNILHLD